MDGYCRYVPGYPRITGYWDKGGYEGSWNCCTVGKPVLQWRWGVPYWGNWLPETLLAAMTCTAAWVSYVGLPSVLYVRTVGGCLCRLGLGSSSGLFGGLLLSWVRVSCPFPLSDPVSSVSSKTVRSPITFPWWALPDIASSDCVGLDCFYSTEGLTSSSVTASFKVCPVWGFLGAIVYSSLLQVSSAKSSACGTGIWLAVLRLSFRTLLSLFWLVSFGMLMRRLLHDNSKFPFRVLFPPVPASGLTSYTGLSSPLRLMTMWIWSSQCERSFPGLPRSLRLRTRTLSPGRS